MAISQDIDQQKKIAELKWMAERKRLDQQRYLKEIEAAKAQALGMQGLGAAKQQYDKYGANGVFDYANDYGFPPGALLGQQQYRVPIAPWKRAEGQITASVLETNGIFTAPLSAVKDLWRLKYPGWVTAEQVRKDGEDAVFMFKRLQNRGALETIQAFTDKGQNETFHRLLEEE